MFLFATTFPAFPVDAMEGSVLALVLWLIAVGSYFAVRKIKNEAVAAMVSRFFLVLQRLVRKCYQTFVAGLKDENGKLSPEQAKEALESVLAELKKYIGLPGLKKIAFILGFGELDDEEVETFAVTMIESEIDKQKKEAKAKRLPVDPSAASAKE
ncbi:MAG: hypothetical protein ACOC0J_01160 [Myxococcota bacterium]